MLNLMCFLRDLEPIYSNDKAREYCESLINKFAPFYLNFVPVKALPVKKRKREVIVSMTTIPSRIDSVWIPLICILRQSVRPDHIYLWLGKDKFEGHQIPDKLEKLKKKGVEIFFCEDVKAHTKYYYTMQKERNHYVITVDDDILYRKDMIKGLIKTQRKYPGTVCAHWVWEIKATNSGQLCPTRVFKGGDLLRKDLPPSHKLLALGVGGVLYPPRCLQKEAFDKDKIRQLSYNADDIWLKGMEILNNKKVAKVSEKYKTEIILEKTQEVALRYGNVNQNQNDIQLRNVFQYYHIHI